MASWSMELSIDTEATDIPPPSESDPNSCHVSLTLEFQLAFTLVAPETPPHETIICREAKSGLVSRPEFLSNIEGCFDATVSAFDIELCADVIDHFAPISRLLVEANPNRRVVPLRLIVRAGAQVHSVDAIERYKLDFPAALSAVAAAAQTELFIESLQLVSREGTAGEEEVCSICWDDGDGERKNVRTPCSHEYHMHCLVRWLRINHTCPLCRYEFY